MQDRQAQTSHYYFGADPCILADFLEMLPPHNALSLWIIHIHGPRRPMDYMGRALLRKRKRAEIEQGRGKAPAAVEEGLDAIALPHTGEARISRGGWHWWVGRWTILWQAAAQSARLEV
jgi:hypothetical protein